jgi:hypothetical protein
MNVVDLYNMDCRDAMSLFLPDNSVDAIVCDPPYGLSFMGKKWDYDVPSVEIWAECLRVLKPGGHLLAFAGTRTQHRMACRIEDAGFEIRDMIAWVYGSGFPKSLDVSKAIDKVAGAEREVMGRSENGARNGSVVGLGSARSMASEFNITAPATDAARQWQGWGTALKPALETVTFASKPYTDEQERDIILSNLIRLEARLWLLSSASAAEKNSTSNPSEYGAACGIAQWSAEETTSTRAALCDQMGMSLFELATTTSLSIVSSWRRTLAESWSDGSTSTIETRSSTTTDWKTLKFSLSQITAESIIKACSLPGGFSANATTAESHFNASLSLLQSIRTLSATERAMSQAQHEHQGAGVKPNLDPCIMARKPLIGTVAANVLAHGTGALNIDGCRVATAENLNGGAYSNGSKDLDDATSYATGVNAGEFVQPTGRWPANLIHDGSSDVVAAFPDSNGSGPARKLNRSAKPEQQGWGMNTTASDVASLRDAGTGSAARFFYVAKVSGRERNEGLPDGMTNIHPTLKPVSLMAYLCRLVTPPGGVVFDPFMGSGSTGKAALREGFGFIGCEMDAAYFAIAQARLAAVGCLKNR